MFFSGKTRRWMAFYLDATRPIQQSSGTSKMRPARRWRRRALGLMTCALFVWVSLGCGNVFPPPRDQWLSDGWSVTPYIFSEWQGIVATQTLHSREGSSEVLVLEQVSGPDGKGATKGTYPVGYTPPAPTTQPRVESLVNANGAALTPEQFPVGTRTSVDGFKRAVWTTVRIRPANSKYWRPARGSGQENLGAFPQIKVRAIYKIGDDGKRERIWITDIPFEHL
ncbi:hypothetical protein BH09PLA1_BH09PLA1_29600 [soil metagenome]